MKYKLKKDIDTPTGFLPEGLIFEEKERGDFMATYEGQNIWYSKKHMLNEDWFERVKSLSLKRGSRVLIFTLPSSEDGVTLQIKGDSIIYNGEKVDSKIIDLN